MIKLIVNYLFPKEEWCHCPCERECGGKLYYCEVCDDGYCENCIDNCHWFKNSTKPICEWCER